MRRNTRRRIIKALSPLSYEQCESRRLLTVTVDVGNLRSGVTVADNATGEGFIMYSDADVHERFNGIGADNADHFVAVRLSGNQWQYNNDQTWFGFKPQAMDSLVAKVNFDGDSVLNGSFALSFIEGIWFRQEFDTAGNRDTNFRVVANQFGGHFDLGEFTILGSTLNIEESVPPIESELQLQQISLAVLEHEAANSHLPGLANFDGDGNPLLSWRVHLLPHMGMEDLYREFNLDEPWNSANNIALAGQMPAIYQSPNFDSADRTPFLAVAGDSTYFQLDGSPVDRDSVGENPAALLVEVDQTHSAIWTQPVDWYFNESNPLSGLGKASSNGFAISLFGGQTTTLTSDVDVDEFINLVDETDDSPLDNEALGIDVSIEDRIRNVASGLIERADAFTRFPHQAIMANDGTPLLSWRVAILPYIGHQQLFDQFNLNEPWNSATNMALLNEIPVEFQNPNVEEGKTVLLGLDGTGTIFDSTLRDGVAVQSILDGPANTIAFVEADASEAVEWTRPADLDFDAADPLQGLGTLNENGRFQVGLANGLTTSLSTDTPANIPAWATWSGEELNSYDLLPDGDTADGAIDVDQKISQIMLAVENHISSTKKHPHSIYDMADSGDTPLLSWRVRLLPYLGHQALAQQFRFNEPWDSAHNLSLLPLMPPIFETPGVPDGFTVFQGAHGENTLFPNTNDPVGEDELYRSANVASVLQVKTENAIEWTRPGDFEFDPSTIRAVVAASNTSGFHFGLLESFGGGSFFGRIDGSTHFFNDTIGTEVLTKIVSPSDFIDSNVDLKLFRELADNDHRTDGSTANDLRQAALGALDFESEFMHFPKHAIYENPSSTSPLLSWRVEILPFIGHLELYEKFNHDEPWNSAQNLSLIPLMPQIFSHPSLENGKTVVQALSSPWETGESFDTMFAITNEIEIGFGGITDGSSNTILFVESNIDNAVEWTRPQDIVYDAQSPTVGVGVGEHGQGSWVALADGSVRFLPSSLLDEIWAAAASPNGGELFEFNDPASHQYGTIVPRNQTGTEGDDNAEIIIDGDMLEIVLNGSSDTYTYPETDRLFLDGLGGVDLLAIAALNEEIEFVEGVFYAGSFSIVTAGFETVEVVTELTFTIGGSDADDSFEVSLSDTISSVTSSAFDIQLELALSGDILISGGQGNDEITIDSLALDATLSAIQYTNTQSNVFWNEVESVNVTGGDSLTIAGTDGDDTFRFNGEVATMLNSAGPLLSARDITDIFADGGNGNDSAYLAGPTTGATFLASPLFGKLTTATQFIMASDFELVGATSNGPDDFVSFVGTNADEKFYVSEDNARFVSDNFIRNAAGFERIVARSGGGDDFANVTDTEGDDSFFAKLNLARIDLGNGVGINIFDFPTVRSVSSSGNDSARLVGTEGPERFVASDRFGRLIGDGFNVVAVSYPKVDAVSNGGGDEAFLTDSQLRDFFRATPGMSRMEEIKTNGLEKTYSNTAIGFDSVVAFSTSGQDIADFRGSNGDDIFYGNSKVANMNGPEYSYFASNFPLVRAYSNGGNDSATLRDSDESDFFFGGQTLSYMHDNGNGTQPLFRNEVRGFAEVKAVATSGNDIASLRASGGVDLFLGHRGSSQLGSDSFKIQANGFERVFSAGFSSGDTVNLYDSEEDETFGARGNQAWLQGETYRIQITDPDSVSAFGYRGGVNQLFVNDPEFDWNTFGTWRS